MKYCMKCGTLLEDSHEICIGCGADVKDPENWSMYPPEMAKRIEEENKEKKSRGGLIAGMIVVFVLLVVTIAFLLVFNAKKIREQGAAEDEKATAVLPPTEPTEEEAPDESATISELKIDESEKTKSDDRKVSDSNGKYYNYETVKDAGGNTVFSVLFPEDFSVKVSSVNYDVYSTKFPESLTYIVGNEDGNVQMTFMSPQHYWYRRSDKGQTRSNERDVYDYMQFLTYNGAQGYIEALIKQSYTDIKGFKFTGSEEFSPDITELLKTVSDKHTMELTGDIGDYARISDDTVYVAMQAECDCQIYHYEATSRQGNTIYMDFYVPIVANILGYASEYEADQGEITEWIVPKFVAFEAGSEELYEHYKDDYMMFIYNAMLSEEFFYLNESYSGQILDAINNGNEPAKLSADKLKSLHAEYADGKLNEFDNGLYSFSVTNPASTSLFGGELYVSGLNKSRVGYFSKEKNKVFISPSENEYPGSDYVQLTYEAGAEDVSDSGESEEASEAESSGSD